MLGLIKKCLKSYSMGKMFHEIILLDVENPVLYLDCSIFIDNWKQRGETDV